MAIHNFLFIFDTSEIYAYCPIKIKCHKHLLRKGGEFGTIRAEISPYKIRKSCLLFKLLDLTALVSGKITSIYCQILDILGQKRHLFAI